MTEKRVAIIQSSYIPWKGYFDIIHDVDEFIFLDDVQFTRQDWRSRNRIKSPNGLLWLTVPAGTSGSRRICDVTLSNSAWQSKHWKAIQQSYSRAPHFSHFRDFLEEVYVAKTWRSLSELNQFVIAEIATRYLGVTCRITDSREYNGQGQRQDRLIDILQKAGATHYLSGPAARDYIDPAGFAAAGIQLDYKVYGPYAEYPQLHGTFEHAVSILDLLFHVGENAPRYIWGR